MAKNRLISTKFWDDIYIEGLPIEEKLLFLYCLTNESLELCGIYEFSLTIASVRTGIPKEKVMEILRKFEKTNKMKFENGWLAIKNFVKYQNTENGPVKKGIERSLEVAPVALKEWVDNNDIIPQNENGEYESSMSPQETYRTPNTLLNSTLLNLTSPNLTELNSKEKEEKETKAQGSVPSSPGHTEKVYEHIALPQEVEEMFTDFLAMRKAKKVPNTARAIHALRKKAADVLYQEGENKVLTELEKSITNGWRDFYYEFKKTGKRFITEEEYEKMREDQAKHFSFLL